MLHLHVLQATEELQRQKDENLSLNNYIEQIMQELNDKTPALQQLRRDYDTTMQNNTQLSQKLNSMFEECESLRLESEDSVKQAKIKERENQRLKQLTADLGRQVKVTRLAYMYTCLLYTSPSPRDATLSRMPSSA